jgi:1-acyl-sn-glycerol-3-phosphate acyltransferase
MWPAFALHWEGVENLPAQGGFILLPKHQRWVDIPLLGLASPRSLYFVAKTELFQNPLLGWFVKSLGGIPLNRKHPLESREHLHAMASFLRAGEGVVVFPEGTYYRDQMGPGKPGVVRWILNRLEVPFIPVGIRYQAVRRRTHVWVRFGQGMAGEAGEPADVFLGRAMKEIARLSGLPAHAMIRGEPTR